MANDDQQDVPLAQDSGSEARPPRPEKHVPERKCILTGEHGARDDLIRLAIAPDGTVMPDIRAKAPGRGAWIGIDKAALETAIAKGKLKSALARAFKGGTLVIPADLAGRVEDGLRRAALDRLGLEARAGALLTGSDRRCRPARPTPSAAPRR